MGSFHFFSLVLSATLALSAPGSHPHSCLAECLYGKSLPFIVQTSANYTEVARPFNLRVPSKPEAFVTPSTPDQVAQAIMCASIYDVKVAARSGGHSYAGYGLGGRDGSLVIDMKKFKTIALDPVTNIATIGAGNRLGDIATSLYELGKRALPHGLCPGVGISGHALHGGFGYTSRMWGTTLDTIISMEVVLADSSIVNVSKTENPDLFWALRGAGSSYGIVTKFVLQTQPAPTNGVSFIYTFPGIKDNSVAGKTAIITAVQDFAATQAPKELALRVMTLTGMFQITGVYWGTKADFDLAIAPLLKKWPTNTKAAITQRGWLESLSSFFDNAELKQPEVYTQHDTFFAKSIVTPGKLTECALTSFFRFLSSPAAKNAPVEWWVIFDLYGGESSAITSKSLESASYAPRNALFTIQLYSNPPNYVPPYPAAGIGFMDEMVKSMTSAQKEATFMSYANYADPSLSAAAAHKQYYGSQYPRLESIKCAVDPQMRFWNPQAIGVH